MADGRPPQGDFTRTKAAGTSVITEQYSFEAAPGSSIALFADPDDNCFQLLSPIEMPAG